MRPWMPLQITVLALATALAAPLGGQAPVAIDPSLLSGVTLRAIGPANTGGRIDDFAVARAPGQPDAIYVATASGGVFKSVNGTSWTPIFDRVDAMMSIGDIAVAVEPERRLGRNRRGEQPPELVVGRRRLQVDRRRADLDAVGLGDTRTSAASSSTREPRHRLRRGRRPLWGPNAERGVFKTTDGGATWKKVLYVDDNTGANDLVDGSRHPQALYAAMYQRQRKAWGFNGGGPGSGIFRPPTAARPGRAVERPAAGRQGTHRPRHLLSARSTRDRLRDRRVEAAAAGAAERGGAADRRRSAATRRVSGSIAADGGDTGTPRSTPGRGTTARSGPIRRTQPGVPARIESRLLHLQRRRQDVRGRVQHRGAEPDSLRGPRAVDRSRRHQPPDRRRRRRRVDLVGPRPDVAVPRQPAGRAVLRDQRRHAGAVHGLRRPAGQRPLVRAERHARSHRHLEPRRLQHRQRRRLLRAARSERRTAYAESQDGSATA